MNKKLIVRFDSGALKSCVLDGNRYIDDQLTEKFGYRPGCGYAAEINGDKVRIYDVFHQDTVATLPIVSFEDTTDKVDLNWTEISS